MSKETPFRQWRARMGFTQDEAAEALGVSKSQVANWDAGRIRGRARGEASAPPYAVRVLMGLLARGEAAVEWASESS